MGVFGNRRLSIVVLGGIIGAGLAVAGLWFFTDLFSPRPARNVETLLLEADDYIQTGYFNNAHDILNSLVSYSGSVQNWFSILKRAHQLGKNTNDYSVMLKLARSAVKDIPGNEKLWTVYVYAELRNGLYAKAYEHAADKLGSGSYPALETEAYLKSGKAKDDDEAMLAPTPYGEMLVGFREKTPSSYLKAEEMTKKERFRLLAALLHMHYGNLDTAHSIMETVSFKEAPEASFFIELDVGNLDTAENYLARLREQGVVGPTEALFLQADIHMMRGEKAEAEEVYKKIIENAPKESWIPYLNLTWIAETTGEADGFDYILEAYEVFPEKKDVILPAAWYLMERNQPEQAKERLENYLDTYPEDPDIELLYASVSSSISNPAKYKAVLWQLFNRYPENVTVARYLCWYLFGLEDFEELEKALNQFEKRVGNLEWVFFFRGAMYSVLGDYEEAENYYLKALEISDRWETYYNLGLIELARGYADSALENFRKAEHIITRKTDIGKTVSDERRRRQANIYIKIAIIHFLNENYSTAQRNLVYGLKIAPDNLEGRLLIKKLEAAEKR